MSSPSAPAENELDAFLAYENTVGGRKIQYFHGHLSPKSGSAEPSHFRFRRRAPRANSCSFINQILLHCTWAYLIYLYVLLLQLCVTSAVCVFVRVFHTSVVVGIVIAAA